uniref:BarH like homeobox 1 n=1 Tax=Anas platyrhynchos TaxID=8839 RepID=A0A8B9R844_ANAPL
MEGSTGFGIDSILSHRAGSPAGPKGDPLGGDGRSPLELSPRSEGSSGCPSPRSPGRECLEAAGPHLQPGQGSAPSQSRTVTSSFLIRDILADCKPLAACAPYSSTNGPHGGQEPAGRIPTKPGEDFREKMEKTTSSSSSDSEYKVKEEGDREISSSRDSPPVRLKKAAQSPHRLHRPSAGPAGAQLREAKIPERAGQDGAGGLPQPHRHAGENLVPEQKDQVEKADGGGPGAAGRGRQLLSPAEDVPLALLLPAELGLQPGPRRCPLPVPRTQRAAPGPPETPGAPHPHPRTAGRQRAPPSPAPPARRPAPGRAAPVSPGLPGLPPHPPPPQTPVWGGGGNRRGPAHPWGHEQATNINIYIYKGDSLPPPRPPPPLF